VKYSLFRENIYFYSNVTIQLCFGHLYIGGSLLKKKKITKLLRLLFN